MASGAVAATIMATHQVAQNFARGSAQGLNQQQAFILAQKSISLATLMVNKNVVVCSNARIKDGIDGWNNQVRGCYRMEPLAREDREGKLTPEGEINKIAHDFYGKLDLDTPPSGQNSWFTKINLNFGQMEGKEALIFNALDSNLENNSHSLFKNTEVTWAIRNTNDPSIREALSYTQKGVICRDQMMLEKPNGYCPPTPRVNNKSIKNNPLDMKYGLDSHLASIPDGLACKDSQGGRDLPGTFCDYYSIKDSDESIIFISAVVPYQRSGNEKKQKIVMNAAVRRPLSVVHIRPVGSQSCSMKCESATNKHYENEFPRCVGLSDYSILSNGTPGVDNYPEGTQLLQKELGVLNKGPGVLFDIALKREDIDMDKRSQLGAHIVSAREFLNGSDPSPIGPGGSRIIQDLVPCYYSSYYEVNVKRVTCTCRQGPPGSAPTTGPDGSVCAGSLICNEVIESPTTLARSSSTDAQPFCPSTSTTPLPPLAGSWLTRFQSICQQNGWPCAGTASRSISGCETRTRTLPGAGATPANANANILGAQNLNSIWLSR